MIAEDFLSAVECGLHRIASVADFSADGFAKPGNAS